MRKTAWTTDSIIRVKIAVCKLADRIVQRDLPDDKLGWPEH
jgi:hypothetical protein